MRIFLISHTTIPVPIWVNCFLYHELLMLTLNHHEKEFISSHFVFDQVCHKLILLEWRLTSGCPPHGALYHTLFTPILCRYNAASSFERK